MDDDEGDDVEDALTPPPPPPPPGSPPTEAHFDGEVAFCLLGEVAATQFFVWSNMVDVVEGLAALSFEEGDEGQHDDVTRCSCADDVELANDVNPLSPLLLNSNRARFACGSDDAASSSVAPFAEGPFVVASPDAATCDEEIDATSGVRTTASLAAPVIDVASGVRSATLSLSPPPLETGSWVVSAADERSLVVVVT